jgi:CDP-diacylglycerol--serine O-phosphatidyltransferase
MWHFMDAANALTMSGLAAAVTCMLLAMNQQIAFAVIALMVSGFCDLFDGVVARRLSKNAEQRQFGARLDSIVDGCAFGLAPVVLLYSSGLNGIAHLPLLLLFAASAVWRLAYFDTVGFKSECKVKCFAGLPTTYVALLLPLAFIPGLLGEMWRQISLVTGTTMLALAMVSTFPVRKPSGKLYVLFPAIGFALVITFIVFADRFNH